jgi:hypothetical protein
MGRTRGVKAFLESDVFSNLTAFLALIVAVVAVIYSAMAYNNSSAAQRDQAAVQADDIEVYSGFVSLWADGYTNWHTFERKDDAHDPPVSIPLAEWQAATARHLTVRIVNRGRQKGFFEGVYMVTDHADPINGWYCNAAAMQPQCSISSSETPEWKACPDAMEPNDGYSLYPTIPDEFVAQLTASTRQKGLTVCAHARSARNHCADIGVIIPVAGS